MLGVVVVWDGKCEMVHARREFSSRLSTLIDVFNVNDARYIEI